MLRGDQLLDFYNLLGRATDLGILNIGDRTRYVVEGDRRRPFTVINNELRSRIELHTTVDKLEPINPHTGSPRGGQGFI